MEEAQVLVRLVTKLPAEMRVPEAPVVSGRRRGGWVVAATPHPPSPTTPHSVQAVPSKLKRFGLSQVINHLLALGGYSLS